MPFSDFSGSFFFAGLFAHFVFHFWFFFAGLFPHFFSFLVGTGAKEQRTLLIWKNSRNALGKFRTKIGEANFLQY